MRCENAASRGDLGGLYKFEDVGREECEESGDGDDDNEGGIQESF